MNIIKTGIGITPGEKADRFIHAIRHSCATHLIESGVGIRSVQGLLNHSQISTTQGYAKVTEKAKEDAVANLSLIN